MFGEKFFQHAQFSEDNRLVADVAVTRRVHKENFFAVGANGRHKLQKSGMFANERRHDILLLSFELLHLLGQIFCLAAICVIMQEKIFDEVRVVAKNFREKFFGGGVYFRGDVRAC